MKSILANKKNEFIFIFLVAFIFTGVIMLGFVTLHAGYHLVDDHELLAHEYLYRVEGKSFFEIYQFRLKSDIHLGRWRPVYQVERILSSIIIGQKLPIIYFWEYIRTAVIFLVLYYIARNLYASILRSLIFPAVILCGYQASAWWKLGPQEMPSMLLFSVGILLLMNYFKSKKIRYCVLAVILLLLMANYKEAFLITIPFIMLFMAYFDIFYIKKTKIRGFMHGFKLLWEEVKMYPGLYLCLSAVLMGSLCAVVFITGYGYSGVGNSDAGYLRPLMESALNDCKWYCFFGAILLLITVTYYKELKKLWIEIILVLSLIIPQIVIYGKIVIEDRYLLPMSVGFGLLFLVFIPMKIDAKGIRKWLYIMAIVLLLCAHLRVTLREAEYYRFRGQGVSAMLNIVREVSLQDEKAKVLSCLYPAIEGDITVSDYNLVIGKDNVYRYMEDRDGEIELIVDEDTVMDAREAISGKFEDMDVVVEYNELDRHWCYNPTFDKSSFRMIRCGTIDVYVRKDLNVDIPEPKIDKTLFKTYYMTTVNEEEWEAEVG